jgi:hypothetical protein
LTALGRRIEFLFDRVCFHDPDGNDREFVQYPGDDPAKRNDYDLPDPA